MPVLFPVFASLAASAGADAAGGALAAGLGSVAATGALAAGASALMPKAPSISIPPPPGAALIDPVGQQAAADTRRRMAGAGGLQGTITGAGVAPGANAATSGAKQLSGQ